MGWQPATRGDDASATQRCSTGEEATGTNAGTTLRLQHDAAGGDGKLQKADPDDVVKQHNVGITLMRMQRLDEALAAYHT